MTPTDLTKIELKSRRIAMLACMGAAATGYVKLDSGAMARIRVSVHSECDVAELAKCEAQKGKA